MNSGWIRRVLALVLCAMLACTAVLFTGCNEDKAPDGSGDHRETENTPGDGTNPGNTSCPIPEGMNRRTAWRYPFQSAVLPPDAERPAHWTDDLDYGGESVVVLYEREAFVQEFEEDGVTGETIHDAVVVRNVNVNHSLNVDLKFMPVEGASDTERAREILRVVETSWLVNYSMFDIIAAPMRTSVKLAIRGLLKDLTEVEDSYIDPTDLWWPRDMTEFLSPEGSLYLLTGDMSSNLIASTDVMFFNCDLLEARAADLAAESGAGTAAEMLYGWVREGSWTLDRLLLLNSGPDVDAAADVSTLVMAPDRFSSFYTAAGLKLLRRGAAWRPEVSPDISSEAAAQLLGTLADRCADGTIAAGETAPERFLSGKSIFLQERFSAPERYRFSDKVHFAYSMVPMPKAQAGQADYHTSVSADANMYSIFRGCNAGKDASSARPNADAAFRMLTAVLNCWGETALSDAHATTYQLYYAMMRKPTDDDGMTEMFDAACDSITLDLGYALNDDLSDMTGRIDAAAAGTGAWSENLEAWIRDWEQTIASDTFLAEYEATAG